MPFLQFLQSKADMKRRNKEEKFKKMFFRGLRKSTSVVGIRNVTCDPGRHRPLVDVAVAVIFVSPSPYHHISVAVAFLSPSPYHNFSVVADFLSPSPLLSPQQRIVISCTPVL